jgi:hypothetical protein
VRQNVPEIPELREKDKWLWGKSFHDQLEHDISTTFTSVLRDSAVLWIQQLPAGKQFKYADVECFLRTEHPEDVTSDGADYKNDAREAVGQAIKSKMVARIGRGNFQRQSEDGV